MKSSFLIFIDGLSNRLRRVISIMLAAFMLGISNVILEEDRMVNDTRPKVEHQEIQDEDDNN